MTWRRGSHLEQTRGDSHVKFKLVLFIVELNLKLAHLPPPPPSPASQCLQSVLLSASVPLSWPPPDKHNKCKMSFFFSSYRFLAATSLP